jgi:HAD superfamily hydrolase (TIGR01509 family)
MNIKGVIFDLDGTLVDTEKFNSWAWTKVLKSYGIEFSEEDFKQYAGTHGLEVAGILVDKHGFKVEKGNLWVHKEDLLKQMLLEEEIKLMPFSMEILEFLKSEEIMLAVATGGSREKSLTKLEKSGIKDFFQAVITFDDTGRGKPHPDIYLKAIESIGLDPENLIAVEDTQDGVAAAVKAGLRCLAVPNDLSRQQDFSEAENTFSSLEGVLAYLREQLKE